MLIEFCCFSHSEYLPNTDWFWFGVFSSTSTGIQLSVREREIECLYYFIDVIFFSWILVIFIFHRINLSSENDFSNDFQTHKIHSFLLTVVSLCMELDFFSSSFMVFYVSSAFLAFCPRIYTKTKFTCSSIAVRLFRGIFRSVPKESIRQRLKRDTTIRNSFAIQRNGINDEKQLESKRIKSNTHTHPAHAWQKDDRNGNKERKKNYGK